MIFYPCENTVYKIAQTYEALKNLPSNQKIVLTTEKDAARLEKHYPYLIENQLSVYVLPIEVNFHFEEIERFDVFIKNRLLTFKI